MTFVIWTAIIELLLAAVLAPARDLYAVRAVDATLGTPAASLAAEIAKSKTFPPDLTRWSREPAYMGWGEQLFLELRSVDGAVVASSANLEGMNLPFDAKVLSQSRDGPVFATAPASGVPELRDSGSAVRRAARARLVTVPVPNGVGPPLYFLQAARSLGAMDRASDIFYSVLLLLSAATTLGAGFAGWIVAGRICARLEQVAASVRRVSPTNLDERLDLAELPDEIGRLAADVNVMLERLAVGFRSQERFIYDVSHELKTPVAVLLTEAQSLKMRRHGEPERIAFVLSVEDEMRRLGKLVESLLMLARFGQGRRFLGESVFAVNDVALESIQHSKLLAQQHGITLSLSLYDAGADCDDGSVRGDADLVRIVIDNLIRNAIQYSKRGDTVRVAVGCGQEQTTIAVEDQGRGVPEDHLNTIFDRFAQAPGPTTSGQRGTGLGLAIAKGVVDLHGGTIGVRNRPEGGCAFTVSLPVRRSTHPEPGPDASAVAAPPGGNERFAAPAGAPDSEPIPNVAPGSGV